MENWSAWSLFELIWLNIKFWKSKSLLWWYKIIISAVAVILGLTNQLIDFTVAKYEAIIIGIWLGFYLIMEIILEIIKYCASEGTYQKLFALKFFKMSVKATGSSKPNDLRGTLLEIIAKAGVPISEWTIIVSSIEEMYEQINSMNSYRRRWLDSQKGDRC